MDRAVTKSQGQGCDVPGIPGNFQRPRKLGGLGEGGKQPGFGGTTWVREVGGKEGLWGPGWQWNLLQNPKHARACWGGAEAQTKQGPGVGEGSGTSERLGSPLLGHGLPT